MSEEKEKRKKEPTVYLCLERNSIVHSPQVKLSDIATVLCSDKVLQRKVGQLTVLNMQEYANPVQVISVMKIMEDIQKEFGDVPLHSIGETDGVVELEFKKENKTFQYIKTVFICLVLFFGSAFTIMSFHGDIGIQDMFGRLYWQMTGENGGPVTVLEVSYSIGIFIGVMVFFNHLGKKKVTSDPTPIQVQMREYEKTVDETFIENTGRKGSKIDVS
ncbi:MAG: stage V sporulation protein AA [Lachnospiraceae bacterium]